MEVYNVTLVSHNCTVVRARTKTVCADGTSLKGKGCHIPLGMYLAGCSSPFLRPRARRWINH